MTGVQTCALPILTDWWKQSGSDSAAGWLLPWETLQNGSPEEIATQVILGDTSLLGSQLWSMPDRDGDGDDELLLTAPQALAGQGAIYLLPGVQ